MQRLIRAGFSEQFEAMRLQNGRILQLKIDFVSALQNCRAANARGSVIRHSGIRHSSFTPARSPAASFPAGCAVPSAPAAVPRGWAESPRAMAAGQKRLATVWGLTFAGRLSLPVLGLPRLPLSAILVRHEQPVPKRGIHPAGSESPAGQGSGSGSQVRLR
jgi:hypothetical protein